MDDNQDQDEVQPARYGYGKFYRKVTDSPVFQNLALLQLYIVISRDAAIKERDIAVWTGRGHANVHLQPGEFLSRKKSTALLMGWNEETYRKRLNQLMEYGVIREVRSTNLGTVVSLVDFSETDEESGSFDTTLKQAQIPPQTVKTVPHKKDITPSLFVGDCEFEAENNTTLNKETVPT